MENLIEDLRKKTKELKDSGKMKLIFHRVVNNPKGDIEGLRKIIKDNPIISQIDVIPKNPAWLDFIGCDEYFYTTDDEEYNKVARDQILKI